MSHPHQPLPPPSQQSKADLQRVYREKENTHFNALRKIIKDLTGEEPRKRQEVLMKATEILFIASEMKRQKAQIGNQPMYEAYPPISYGGSTSTSHTAGYSGAQLQFPQKQSSPNPSDTAALYNATYFHLQQSMSDMNSVPDQSNFEEDWPNYL